MFDYDNNDYNFSITTNVSPTTVTVINYLSNQSQATYNTGTGVTWTTIGYIAGQSATTGPTLIIQF